MFFKKEIVTAVDPGSRALKLVRAELGNNSFRVLNYGKQRLPEGCLEGGRLKQPETLAQGLNNLLQAESREYNRLVTTMPGSNLFIRILELPRLQPGEVEEAVYWQAEELLPFPAKQARMDYLIIDRGEDMLTIQLVAAREQVVREFAGPFTRISHPPAVINARPMALISLLNYQGWPDRLRAIFNLDYEGIQAIIADYRGLRLSRSLEIDTTESRGQPGSSLTAISLNTGVIAERIARFLKFYSIQEQQQPIREIVLTGSLARDQGLLDSIREELSLESKVLDPFFGSEVERQAPEFAVSLGLLASEVLKDVD